jgi:copper chaperone CopZ
VSVERTYVVHGMSCGHCALSVREEVTQVGGVTEIDVDLDSGRLDVTGTGFSDDDVEAAVVRAGYAVGRNTGA